MATREAETLRGRAISDGLQAVRQALRDAANSEHYPNLSDAERLVWLIQRGFELGRKELQCTKSRSERTAHAFSVPKRVKS